MGKRPHGGSNCEIVVFFGKIKSFGVNAPMVEVKVKYFGVTPPWWKERLSILG